MMTIDQKTLLFWTGKKRSEDLNGKITALFEGIEEKLNFKTVRVGKVSLDQLKFYFETLTQYI